MRGRENELLRVLTDIDRVEKDERTEVRAQTPLTHLLVRTEHCLKEPIVSLLMLDEERIHHFVVPTNVPRKAAPTSQTLLCSTPLELLVQSP